MRIVSDGGPNDVLETEFSDLCEEASDEILIYIELLDAGGLRSTRTGLDKALAAAAENPSSPIILVGWQAPADYADDPRWQRLQKLPNTVFRQLPVQRADIIFAIQEARDRL